MRRSEMLLLIVNQLHFLDGRFSGYTKDVTEEEIKRADVILTTLETAGMQPPPIQVQEFLVPAQDGQEALIPYTTTVNQWTPEE